MERQLFETSVATGRARRALTLPASMTVHALVIVAALVLPLLGGSDLPEVAASGPRVFFVEPQAPPVIPPPPAPVRGVRRATTARTPAQTNDFVAPSVISSIIIPDDPDDSAYGPGNGNRDGGVEGGDPFAPIDTGVFKELPQVVQQPVRVAEWQAPTKLRHVQPEYPALARQARVQGVVVLECVITPRGRVENATVVEGSPLLTEAARQAVLQWVYTPMLQNGVPIPILLRVRVQFSIR
jgi:protein TonB